jgi:thiamine pyrophosphate-dependent acetolactate synthase large subunit-like protein
MTKTNQYHGMYLGDPEIDFVGLAASQGVKGRRVTHPGDLPDALREGLRATRGGSPYLLEVVISRMGPGADSTWYHKYSVAAQQMSRA